MQFAHMVLPTLFVLYAGNRYGWPLQATGAALAAAGVCGVIVQVVVTPRLVPRIGELRAMVVGLLAGALAIAIYGLAPSGRIFLVGLPIGAFAGLFMPGFQAIVTRRVGASEQGRLQGANSSIAGPTSMVAPATFGFVYAWSVRPESGTSAGVAFLLAAGLMALGAVVTAVAVAPHSATPAKKSAV